MGVIAKGLSISVFVLRIFEKKCAMFFYDLKMSRPCSSNLSLLPAGKSRFRLQLQLIQMKHQVNRALLCIFSQSIKMC